MKKINKKFEPVVRVKYLDDGGEFGSVGGYVTTFDALPDRDGDRILKGAAGTEPFSVAMLAYHDHKSPVGSINLMPDLFGITSTGPFANTVDAQEMRELAKAGALSFSIGFMSDDYEPNEFGGMDFKSIDIYEVSLVPVPANPRALVTAVKSYEARGGESIDQSRKKQYVDVEPPAGSFEAVQEEIREALQDLYAGPNSYISLVSTFTDRVVYSVESYPSIPAVDGLWQIDYGYGDDGVLNVSWPAVPAEVQQSIVTGGDETDSEDEGTTSVGAEKAEEPSAEGSEGDQNQAPEAKTVVDEKAGRRNASTDQSALDQAHDLLVVAGANCDKMIAEHDGEQGTDQSKATDASAKQRHASARPDLRLLTEIAEFEATV